MKVAASIFSWHGGILTAILGFIFLIKGRYGAIFYSCNYGCVFYIEKYGYPDWAWALWTTYCLIMLIILVWRQGTTSYGKKVACGIFTLLFCSLIGGILTLCIPRNQLHS